MTTEAEIAEAVGRHGETLRHLIDAENALDRARYHAELETDEIADIRTVFDGERGNLLTIIEGLEKALAEAQTAPPLPEPVPVDIYQNGAAYPPAAKIDLHPAFVAPGATVAHVEVTLDRRTYNTVRGFLRAINGTGTVGKDSFRTVEFYPVADDEFSDDMLKQTVSFPIKPMTEGQFITVAQVNVPDGGLRGTAKVAVTCRAGEPTASLPAQPKPPAFVPIGALVYDRAGSYLEITDEGSETSFATRLPHGRTQGANGETGYYGELKYGHIRQADGLLVLETKPAPAPIAVGAAMSYRLLSAIISGHRCPEVQFQYGTVEWEVMGPNSTGCWPAYWLLPKGGWPPEIDTYEGFLFNRSWNPASSLSANLHGGAPGSGVRKWTRPAANTRMEHFGLAPTLDSAFHRFATTITPDWIVMFVDGVEIMRYANPFAGRTWFPLTQLTTKADPDAVMTGKSTLELRRLRVWR